MGIYLSWRNVDFVNNVLRIHCNRSSADLILVNKANFWETFLWKTILYEKANDYDSI